MNNSKDSQNKVTELKNVSSSVIDIPARNTFATYLRLARNEVSHCNDLRKEPTETMLLFMSFVKYTTLITDLINKIKAIV